MATSAARGVGRAARAGGQDGPCGPVEPRQQYLDDWYSDMVYPPVKDEIMQRHLGLPPHLLSTSPLPWDGIAELVEALKLADCKTLLDLACGRGGYGPEIAALPERLRRVDVEGGLTAAGFHGISVQERPAWRAAERAMWVEAAEVDPGGDKALQSLHEEGVQAYRTFDSIRRTLATATAPR